MRKEAIKLALEALKNSVDLVIEDAYNAEKLYGNYPTRQGKVGGLKVLAEDHKKAIKALEEALAKQEQGEPVAWITPDGEGFRIRFSPPVNDVPLGWDALYTTPQQRTWVGLTTKDQKEIQRQSVYVEGAIRMTEAKLKEKNNA